MKIIGIIAEYNPFHNGHLYQINTVKKMYPDSLIIAIISTNFTQRGDVSILNKWNKTKICLEYGIDLVVELPTLYATQAADMFAYGAINILNSLGVNTLVFGTECDNVDDLIKIATLQLNNVEYDQRVQKYLNQGINYPTAKGKAIYDIIGKKIDKPNDLLALSYIKEIIKNNYDITPISIKRTNEYHGKKINSDIISANLIRELISNDQDILSYVPKMSFDYIIRDVNINNAYNLLLYNIINNKDKLSKYLMVDEGIENRIIKNINTARDLDSLIMMTKSKRYTYNKIKRMFLHILLNIAKEDNNYQTYIRVLGFNSKGRSYLNKIKKNKDIIIFTNYKSNRNKTLDIEFKSTFIYSLIVNNPELIQMEYKNKPIIIDD